MELVGKFAFRHAPVLLVSCLAIAVFIMALVFGKIDIPAEIIDALTFVSTAEYSQRLQNSVKSAKSSIYLICDSVAFSAEIIQELTEAASRGVKIEVIAPSGPLPFDGILYPLGSSVVMKDGVLSNLAIFDQKDLLFAASSLISEETCALFFANCPSIINDINAFFNYGVMLSHLGDQQMPTDKWEHNLIVNHNTIYPHVLPVGNLSFPQYYLPPPARDSMWDVISALISRKSKRISMMTNTFLPQMGSRVYFDLSNALINAGGSASLQIILSTKSPNFNESIRWSSMFYSLKDTKIRVIDSDLPTFIVADTGLGLFSHPLADRIFGKGFGLALITEGVAAVSNFQQYFDEMWDKGIPLSNYIDLLF